MERATLTSFFAGEMIQLMKVPLESGSVHFGVSCRFFGVTKTELFDVTAPKRGLNPFGEGLGMNSKLHLKAPSVISDKKPFMREAR